VTITRRNVLLGTAGLAVLVAIGAIGTKGGWFGLSAAGAGDALSAEELMKPGPLGEMAEGNVEAPVTIIEYASMTCSHCAAFATNVYPELKKRYIDTGKVRFIVREFPLDPVVAVAGFMLARCAGEGKYFGVMDLLFQQQANWAFTRNPLQGLGNLAKQAGISHESFEQCLANQKLADGIEWVRQRGIEKFRVESTPTFFVNGKVVRGEIPIEEFAKLIDPYLKG
jgi:protein-disulfide isomerase